MPKKERGSSQSIRPVSKRPPAWCRYKPEEVEAMVVKLAKEGHPASMIGTILRDRHGVPLTKPITGKRITQILKGAGLAPPLPEDFETLLKKAAGLRLHLEKNKKDLAEIPKHIKRKIKFIAVDHMQDVLSNAILWEPAERMVHRAGKKNRKKSTR